jgi:Glycosyl hydrolases family 28/D-galactarate dehydratase / Altronate hydrolase, C terminus
MHPHFDLPRVGRFILYRITLRNSPNFHVAIEKTNGFTAWGVKIDTPATARNTSGVVIRVASGEIRTKAESLGQDDFIPWKRGVSL